MKMLHVVAVLALGLFFAPFEAQAACTDVAAGGEVWSAVTNSGTHVQFSGSCSEDNEVLIETGDVSRYTECSIMSTTGAVDVLVSIDGTTYGTAHVSLIDLGATDTAPVLVTAALRYYAFPLVGGVRRVRVIENGATDAAATLSCK